MRLALLKKLAGTTWGADTVTLRRLYTGRVRPELEYDITAWNTTAKSNSDRVSKVQNQVTRGHEVNVDSGTENNQRALVT